MSLENKPYQQTRGEQLHVESYYSVSMVLARDEVEESFEAIVPLESHPGAARAVTCGRGRQVPVLYRSCPTWSKTGRD